MSSDTTKFKNACFISYKHPPPQETSKDHFWLEFAKAFEQSLNSYLTVKIQCYRDNRLKSKPGIKYTQELSHELCKSVCLVAILVPEYWESNWCRAEWEAMEKLERKRLGRNKQDGLILPVIFRGNTQDWRKLIGDREPIELKVDNPTTQFNSVKNRRKFEAIANRINQFSKNLNDPCVNCDRYRIPVVNREETEIGAEFTESDPLAWK